MSASPQALDEVRRLTLQHAVGLRQFENGLAAKAERVVMDTLKELSGELIVRYSDLTPTQLTRMRSLYTRLTALVSERYQEFSKEMDGYMRTLGRIETGYAERVLVAQTRAVGIEINSTRLTAEQVANIVKLPMQGALPDEWWKTAANNLSFNARRQLQIGLLRGESTQDLTRRLVADVGRSAQNSARMLVRTTVTHVSAETNVQTFKAQGDEVTEEYQYVATLDDRTSIICAELDGKKFRYDDDSAPRPPQHPNCRSTLVPVVNWKALGVSQSPDDILPATRASMDGPTSYKTYSSWLSAQPAETQDTILGPTRGRLFRSGEASLRDLVSKDGSVLTLEQLSKKLDL